MFSSSHLHRRFPRRFGALMISGALVASFAGLAGANPASAATTTVSPIDFESDYTAGNINGQNGWSKTGQYDVEVENVFDYAAASAYGFETKALRASNFYADGAFGGQTFSPGLTQAAGEGDAASYFTASFEIGTTKAEYQPGLAISVSPDDGHGGRMSYLRFDDQADGVHVVFVDVTGKGPVGTTATFNPDVPIATLDRAKSHAFTFEIAFVDGPGNAEGVGNDVVKIFVDGVLKHTGTTWENYYRYDPEQAGNHNSIPTTSKLLFAARGGPVVTLGENQGYLIDEVGLSSSATAPQPTLDEPVTPKPVTPHLDPQPANPQPVAQVVVPQAVVPQTLAENPGTDVLGETLVRTDTLPRTGTTAIQPLAIAGGLGLALGLVMLMLAYRRTAVESH